MSHRLAVALAATLVAASASAQRAESGGAEAPRSRKITRGADRLPAHPRELKFPPLTFRPPVRTEFRHEAGPGVALYVVPDHVAALVEVSVAVRAGAYLDPEGKEGLAEMAATLARSGGAGSRDAEAFDDEAAFLAADLSVGAGRRQTAARLNVLSKDLDAGLDLLFSMLREPRFEQDRFEQEKRRILQGLGRRNDSTTSIEQREWARLQYGEGHVEAREPTRRSIESITREDLQAFARRWWHPGNFAIAVSGDVEAPVARDAIDARLRGWPAGEKSSPPGAGAPPAAGGVRVVNKPDVNQTRVSIGHRSTKWDDPNWAALEIMNEILGGGGFTSRITQRVRSDEGLAYSAGSQFSLGEDYPRTFRAAFQSKNPSVARAAVIVLEEIRRLRDQPVKPEELQLAKTSAIDSFPARFSSARRRAELGVDDELLGRQADWWTQWRERIGAVTAEDVQRVAREYLHPDELTILVVGNVPEVVAGDPDHPEHQLVALAGPGGLVEIPLPDPATLARQPERAWGK